MTFDDTLHLLGRDMTFGAFTPIMEMMSPFMSPLHSHVWHLWRTFSWFCIIFVLEASLGVGLDLSSLYHGFLMFLRAFSGY
jgi:hypothetical protein